MPAGAEGSATGTLPRPAGPADRDDAVRPRPRGRRLPWRALLAVLGGLVTVLAFPGPALVWPAVLGPMALALAVHGRSFRAGLGLGLLWGLAFFVPLLSWTGIYVGSLPWLALAVSQAVFLALLGGATALTSRLPAWPLWAAALWVAQEALRGRLPFGGFPWGRLGFSQTDGPLMSLAAYGGVPFVSFAVALVGTLLAAAVLALVRRGRGTGRSLRQVAVPLAGGGLVLAVGALAWLPLPGRDLTAGGPAATVAVIQGDVPRAGLDFNAQRRAVLDNHVQRTLELAAAVAAGEQPQPDAVIWPENSSDIDPYVNEDANRQIARAAEAVGAPVLVGAIVQGPGEQVSNTAIVWDPEAGPGETYVKRHPVPFAEYIPFRSFFRPFSHHIDRVTDQHAGDEVGLLDVGGVQVGDLICFEVVYDGLVDDVVDAGAGLLVVQTNNATFGYTAESEQQLALSRLRAVETGRTVVVAATSGISAVVAPDGSVVRSSELFTPDVFVEEIAQRSSLTPASRVGAVPEWVLAAVGAGALLVAVPAGRRLRRRAGWTGAGR